MKLWGRREAEQRDTFSISDPVLAGILGLTEPNDAGVQVTTRTAMNLTAVYRAVSLIAGTIAGLPLHTYQETDDGGRQRVPSVFDDPGRFDGYTRFEWTEFVMVSLLLHGNAYLARTVAGGGEVVGYTPVHPSVVAVKVENGRRLYRVGEGDRARTMGARDLVHVMALSTDGIAGLSPITAARQAIGTGLAGDKSAARMFRSPMLAGIVTTEEDVTSEEAQVIDQSLKNRISGPDNAGQIAFVNRRLKFTPWSMSAADAEFIAGRSFQVVEIARLYGLPPILLADTEKTTSWGAGVQEIIRSMAKFTLLPWTSRLEERLSTHLPDGQFVEFDYAGLLQGDQAQVTDNLLKEIGGKLLTVDEARAILNRPPLPKRDADRVAIANLLVEAGWGEGDAARIADIVASGLTNATV